MSEVFLEVLNTSISASWIVLAVVIARYLLRRAPRGMICWLWWLVGVRLWFGQTIQTPFSLIPSTHTIAPESLYDPTPVITSGVEAIDRVVNPVYTQSFTADMAASVNPLQIFTAVFANLWILGQIVLWVWALVSWLRLRRRVRPSVRVYDNVYLCDDIDTPFILGFFTPKIYLPSTLPQEQRLSVIAHEQAHIARHDHLWKPLAYFLLSGYWFNPVMWVAYILLCRDIELACDEQVIKAMTAQQKKDYSTALLECSIHRRMISACPLAFGEVGVKERVKAVLSYKKPAFWVIVIGVVVCAVMALGFLTDPMSRTAEIQYNGVYYIQEGAAQNSIPADAVQVGEIQTGIVDTGEHPTEDFQAVNLREEYAGSDLSLSGDTLYAREPDGSGYLPFVLRTPDELLQHLTGSSRNAIIGISTENTWETETLPKDASAALAQILQLLAGDAFTPDQTERPAGTTQVYLYLYDETPSDGVHLYRLFDGRWILNTWNEEFGTTQWRFDSPELDDWVSAYVGRASYYGEVFADMEYANSHHQVQINYITYSHKNAVLRIGIPTQLSRWESETIQRAWGDNFVGCRYRPQGAEVGWVNVYYYPEGSAVPSLPQGTREEIAFSTGLTGTKITPEGSDSWSVIAFHTEAGTLLAAAEDVDSWWNQFTTISAATCGDIAEAILGTITVHDNGKNVLAAPSVFGVTLSAKDVTPSGLTLVCQQDGTLVEQLCTGSPYFIEFYEDGVWHSIAEPEGTAWTMEAWGVPVGEESVWKVNWQWLYGELPPGRYRIGKSFSGKFRREDSLYLLTDSVSEVCYAEFTIVQDQ